MAHVYYWPTCHPAFIERRGAIDRVFADHGGRCRIARDIVEPGGTAFAAGRAVVLADRSAGRIVWGFLWPSPSGCGYFAAVVHNPEWPIRDAGSCDFDTQEIVGEAGTIPADAPGRCPPAGSWRDRPSQL